jgi:iron complex transport system permease protein
VTAIAEAPPPVVADDRRVEAGRILASARAATARRTRVVSLAVFAVGAFTFCLSVSIGDYHIPLLDVIKVLVGQGRPDTDFIVRTLRLPRALTGALVGAAFGMSGAVFQSLARNPLASPDMIGITEGASAMAVASIVFWHASTAQTAGYAFLGALLSAGAIYLLAYRKGVSPYRMVLVGIGIGFALQSVIQYVLTRAQIYEAQKAVVWLTGSLNARGWEHVRPVSLAMLVLVPCCLLLGRQLQALQLGEDTAVGLGIRSGRIQAGLVLCAVGLCAVATASAGPVNFVAFMAPPISRRLTRSAGAGLVPAALVGATLVLLADIGGRELFGAELPVGVVTGVIGAPYLLWLLARANRVGRGG